MKNDFNIKDIINNKYLGGIGLCLMLLGIMLPYYDERILDVRIRLNLWTYSTGKIMVLLIIINLIFMFIDYIEKYIPNIPSNIVNIIKNKRYSLIPLAVIVVFCVFLFLSSYTDSLIMGYGIGFLVYWLGVICLVIYIVVNKKDDIVAVLDSKNTNNNSKDTVQVLNTIKYCSNCGTQNELDATSCSNCGNMF